MISSQYFTISGTASVFASNRHIASKQHCSVWTKNLSNVWSQLPYSNYDLVNNSIILNTPILNTLVSQVEVRVADSQEELGTPVNDISIVAANIEFLQDNIDDIANAAENAELALQYRNEAEEFSYSLNPSVMLHTLDNIAELKLSSGAVIDKVELLGYYTKGDGGGGTFYWDSTSTETDNGGTIIQATGITAGRWKRVFSGAVNVKWFGAKGDGVTDDADSIRKALLSNANTIILGDGDVFYINSFDSSAPTSNTYFNINKSNLTILGNGSTIKLGTNSDDDSYFIFYNYDVQVTNVKFVGITFNGNSSNNNMKTKYSELSGRCTIRLNFASNSYITNCTFTDFSSIHQLLIGASSVPSLGNVFIDSCSFIDVALKQTQNSVGKVRDHTTIYMLSNKSSVTNCTFVNTEKEAGKYACAYEFHNSEAIFKDNKINGYLRAFIVAAIENANINSILIDSNIIKTTSYCSQVSVAKTTTQTATISNLTISNNMMTCDNSGYLEGEIGSISGAIIFPSEITNGKYNNISIYNNEFYILNSIVAQELNVMIYVNRNNINGLFIKNNIFKSDSVITSFKILNNGTLAKSYRDVVFTGNTLIHLVSTATYEEAIVVYDNVATSQAHCFTISNNTLNTTSTYNTSTNIFFSSSINTPALSTGFIVEAPSILNKVATIKDLTMPVWLINKSKVRILVSNCTFNIPAVTANVPNKATIVFGATESDYLTINGTFTILAMPLPTSFTIAWSCANRSTYNGSFMVFNTSNQGAATYNIYLLKITTGEM